MLTRRIRCILSSPLEPCDRAGVYYGSFVRDVAEFVFEADCDALEVDIEDKVPFS